MSGFFITPIGLALLGLAAPLLLLYFLKLRRTQVIIPSTFLWRKSMRDLTANAPFQRLRSNLLLILQLLLLLLLALALARPYFPAQGLKGENFCLVIDASASMQTEEEGATRFEQARTRAREFVAALESGDRMMIVSFARRAEVECELTDDKSRLREAIEGLAVTDGPGFIGDVLQLVRSLAPDNPDVPSVVADLQLLLLTDGRLSDLEALRRVSVPVTYLAIGDTVDNAGLIHFSVRREQAGQAPQALVTAMNTADHPVNAIITLTHDASVLAVEELEIPAGSTTDRVFELPWVDSGVLQAQLEPLDAFQVDNEAWVTMTPESRKRVLFVGDNDDPAASFFRRAFTLDPLVEWSSMTLDAFVSVPQVAELVIFSKAAPASLPAGTLIFVDCFPPTGTTSAGLAESPAIIASDRTHPAMRFLEWSGVGVQRALKIELPETDRVLLSSNTGPLIADVSRGAQNMLMIAFSPEHSNWPLQLSFPLFVQNVLAWTTEKTGTAMTITAGEAITLPAAHDVLEATVTAPTGETETIPLDPEQASFYAATLNTGVYTVQRGELQEQFAVNLLDRKESSIAPAESLPLGEAEITAAQGSLRFNYELWPWLAGLALAVLLIEWWLYARRAWV